MNAKNSSSESWAGQSPANSSGLPTGTTPCSRASSSTVLFRQNTESSRFDLEAVVWCQSDGVESGREGPRGVSLRLVLGWVMAGNGSVRNRERWPLFGIGRHWPRER